MPLKIYRRPGSTAWQYRGTLAGHRLRGSTGASDKETAQRIASSIEDKFWKRGLDGKEKALTWPKGVALYIGSGKSSRFMIRLSAYWRDARIADINAGSIRQMAIDLYPTARNSTRNRQAIVPTLAVINHCAELNLCQPLRMKRFKIETRIKKPATLEWINAFKANADRLDIATLALFLFATGARISEALSVRWDDIDLRRRTVRIRQSKLGNERIAHLPTEVFVAIANLPRDRKPFPLSITSYIDHWKATIRKAGIERLTFHSCRHGFATALAEKGVPVKTIARLGGWKSSQHLFQTYLHADEDPTLTDRLFDTVCQSDDVSIKKNQ